jgi:hypothetical protein
MAQEEIIFKVGVDTGDSVQEVNEVGNAFDNVNKKVVLSGRSLAELQEEFKKVTNELKALNPNSKEFGELAEKAKALKTEMKAVGNSLNDTTDHTKKSFVGLRQELKQLTVQLQNLDPASKEFENVARRAGQIKEQMRGVADAINDADPEKFGGKFQRTAEGIAGAFSAVTGAQALFGQQSEEIEKQMLKVQGAIALTQGISAMKELKNDALDFATSIKTKLVGAFTSLTAAELTNAQATGTMTTLQKVYTFVVGASTGAMKAFRIALAATGIGAVVVLLGLAADAMGFFGKTTDETAEKVKKLKERQQAYKDQLQAELDLLTKLRAERKDGTTQLENNIRVMKAKGASDKEVYEAERSLIKKQLDELAFALGYKGSLNLEERNKKRQLLTDLQVLDAEYNRKTKEETEKANEEASRKAKERKDKNKQLAEQEAQERLALQRKIEDLTVANIDDANTRDIMSLKLKHDRELEEMQKQYGKKKEFAELEKQLLIQQETEKTALLDEQKKAKDEKAKAEIEKANNDAKALLEADIIRAEEDFNLKQQKRIELENLDFAQQMANSELTNGERELLKAQHEANLVGIAKDSADRQKQIDEATKQSKIELMNAVGSIFGELAGLSKQASGVQKAFAITQVAIDTATALSGLTSISFSPTNGDNIINPLGPYIKLATGTAKIISNMARVKSILGSGVSVAPPTTGGGPNANLGIGANQGAQQTVQAQSTYKVVVVDSDITKMQDKTKKVNAISTI